MRYAELFQKSGPTTGGEPSTTSGLLESVILNELDWFERSPLTQVLNKNKSRWIHFTNVPKIGVNPKSSWTMTGPYGIYLYPVSFILKGNERTADGQQFGTNYPYYFLADIDLGGRGIDLSTVSLAEVEKLAESNGWSSQLVQAVEGNPSRSPGEQMWKLLRSLNDHKTISWNKALRGLAYVVDSSGVMYGHLEPEQIVVLDPRILKNVTMGKNVDVGFKAMNDEKDRHAAWKHAYLSVIKAVQKAHGGKIVWNEDPDARPYDKTKRQRAPALPSLVFTENDRKFTVEVINGRYSRGMRLRYQFGREEAYLDVSDQDFFKATVAEIVAKIEGYIQKVLSFDGDLRFTPLLDEGEAHMLMGDKIGQPLGSGYPWSFEAEITNSDNPRCQTVLYTAERSFEAHEVALKNWVRLADGSERLDARCSVSISGNTFLDISLVEDFTETAPMIAALLDDFEERLRERDRLYGPGATYRWPFHFERDDQWVAFLGWFASNCGMSFDGELQNRFADEIAAYHAYEDQDDLHYKIARVFSKR